MRARYNRFRKIDSNIIKALESLPKVMFNNEGNKVVIRKIAIGNETGVEHISNGMHGLQVKDIKLVPEILKNPVYCCKDSCHRYRKNYYGKKMYKYLFKCYIKIVTHVKDDKSEEIVTIFLADKIKR